MNRRFNNFAAEIPELLSDIPISSRGSLPRYEELFRIREIARLLDIDLQIENDLQGISFGDDGLVEEDTALLHVIMDLVSRRYPRSGSSV